MLSAFLQGKQATLSVLKRSQRIPATQGTFPRNPDSAGATGVPGSPVVACWLDEAGRDFRVAIPGGGGRAGEPEGASATQRSGWLVHQTKSPQKATFQALPHTEKEERPGLFLTGSMLTWFLGGADSCPEMRGFFLQDSLCRKCELDKDYGRASLL